MRRKGLRFLLVLLVVLLETGVVQGLDVTRQMPDEVPFNSTFEVTLNINSDLPVVVGINETLPDGFSFVNASCDYSISGQKVAFAAINVTEIKYQVKAPAQAGIEGIFTGYWVDMLNESEGIIADTTISVTPRIIVDSAGRTVTISKSIERIVVLNSDAAEAVKILDCGDKVVGIVDSIQKNNFYFPEMSQKELVGTWKDVDWEAVVNLTPDLIIAYTIYGADVGEAEENLAPFNITVAGLDLYDPDHIPDEVAKLSVLLESEERASQYLEWYNKYRTIVEELVEGEEKPMVFITSTSATGKTGEIPTYGPGSTANELIELTGGINIFNDSESKFPKVSAEDVLTRNPDVIIIKKGYIYGWDNEDEPKQLINDVLDGKGWDDVNAVKNNRVYIVPWSAIYGMEQPFALSLFVKIFHEIDDINPEDDNVNDPEDVYKEFLENFMGIDYPESKIFYYKMPAPTPTTTPAPSRGGGGGGVSSYIPPSTTLEASSEYHESLLEYFYAGKEKVISISSKLEEKTGITEIGALVDEDIGIVSVTVSKVSSLPAEVTSPDGDLYTCFEIVFTKYGTQTKVEPSGYLKYRISKEWLKNNNAEPSDIKFLKWDGEKWIQLSSEVVGEDNEYYHFKVSLDSFCLFAVVVKEAKAVTTPVTAATTIPVSEVTQTATPKITPKPVATATPAATSQAEAPVSGNVVNAQETVWWKQPTVTIAIAAVVLCFIGILAYIGLRKGGGEE
ncbi:MAG TPA: PGF-pre-PGF domain-containing protein [bacterium (Candidatus Stahlbacteria)]|nr:PGF-pre-PGF domain-containing protein [Candidatus Stahlbacteria bacterium]